MVVVLVIALLWLTNWLVFGVLLFIPLQVLGGLESLFNYGILALGVIVLSWLIGNK